MIIENRYSAMLTETKNICFEINVTRFITKIKFDISLISIFTHL